MWLPSTSDWGIATSACLKLGAVSASCEAGSSLGIRGAVARAMISKWMAKSYAGVCNDCEGVKVGGEYEAKDVGR